MDAALTVGALTSFLLLIATWVSLPQGTEEPRSAVVHTAEPVHA
jgi:hypothetical protein